MEIIGIVGGMGPVAGLGLSKKIINQTIAYNDQDHITQILYSAPERIGDRTAYLLGKIKENPALAIADILLILESMGATVAGLPCNTAHVPQIFEVIEQCLKQKNASIKLLNMIEEVGKFITMQFPKFKKVGILGTLGTYRTRLYDGLEKYGLEVINVPETEVEEVHQSVYHPKFGVKSVSDEISEQTMRILDSACQSLMQKGAQLIVLGCTELPLALPGMYYKDTPLIDTTVVLARALITSVDESKLKELDN